MTVRAKFYCDRIDKTESAYRQGNEYVKQEARTFHLRPVYSDDPNSENKKFWNATPGGELTLQAVNRDVWDKFEIGKEYYLDITHAS